MSTLEKAKENSAVFRGHDGINFTRNKVTLKTRALSFEKLHFYVLTLVLFHDGCVHSFLKERIYFARKMSETSATVMGRAFPFPEELTRKTTIPSLSACAPKLSWENVNKQKTWTTCNAALVHHAGCQPVFCLLLWAPAPYSAVVQKGYFWAKKSRERVSLSHVFSNEWEYEPVTMLPCGLHFVYICENAYK